MIEKPLFMRNRDLHGAYASGPVTPPLSVAKVPYLEETLQRNVGIEIEVEQCGKEKFSLFSGMHVWIVETDQSLRGVNAFEFKSVFPITCAEGIIGIENFFRMVDILREQKKAKFAFSERTSIHVHVDVRDLTETQIKAAVKLYAIFENSFFDLIGRDRKHNIFCIPVCETAVFDDKHGDWRGNWDKYCAINLATLDSYGTLEFRGMAGNDNPQLIIAWIMIVTALVEYANQHTLEHVEKLIDDLKTESHYMELAVKLFGEAYAQNLTIFPGLVMRLLV